MLVPNHLLYTKDHEWVEFKEEYAIVGITDYAQSQLGDVIFVEFPEIGENLNSGSSFGDTCFETTKSNINHETCTGLTTDCLGNRFCICGIGLKKLSMCSDFEKCAVDSKDYKSL